MYSTTSSGYAGVIHGFVKGDTIFNMVMTIVIILLLFAIFCVLIMVYIIYWRIISLLQAVSGCIE